MRTLDMLLSSANEEACGAKNYAICAIEYKTSNQELSRFYIEAARQEMEHSVRLREFASREAEKIEQYGIQVDEEFTEMLSDRLRHIIRQQDNAKRLIDMYR